MLENSHLPQTLLAKALTALTPCFGHRTNLERATESLPSSSPRIHQYPRHSEYNPQMYQKQYEDDVDVDDEPEDQ